MTSQEQIFKKISNRLKGFVSIIVAGWFILSVAWIDYQPPKMYTVTLTLDQWQGFFQAANNLSVIARSSSQPGYNIAQTQDSVIKYMSIIQGQLIQQQQQEVQKKDTISKPPRH